ncbi:MAG: aminomethyl-transferring glycine dehydrogenase subunit GcvPA [Desulfurococcales archaeon]|nr:aminomethyl-transferring glycine dehydrogenase subunit GcvPA [Desulfurococcales archaeon]
MPHPWIPNSVPSVKNEMLRELGVTDVSELFSDVPKELILREPPKVGLGKPLTEYEVRRFFEGIISKNKVLQNPPPFIGGGVCYHYVPAAVKAVITRSEFYTAYTPYQAEIAQGLLQAIFEYQSLMAELYGVDVVNASMYNGSTAAAEAVRMAVRVKRNRRKVLVSKTVHPEIREVIKTWSFGSGLEVVEVEYDRKTGRTDINDLQAKLDDEVAAAFIQYVNFFGVLETDLKDVVELTHKYGALAVVYSNPIVLGVLKSPGELGADIIVGDAQPLGLGLNYGGPSAGILGTKFDRELLRQLPGRLIGATATEDYRELGFTMILQTREQHIRRERATSNITTNSNLEALAAAVYLSLLGAEGIKKIGEAILGRTNYALKKLSNINNLRVPVFDGSIHFMEFPMKVEGRDVEDVHKELISRHIHIGPLLRRFRDYAELRDCSLVCFTEAHTRSDIDLLVSALEEVLR